VAAMSVRSAATARWHWMAMKRDLQKSVYTIPKMIHSANVEHSDDPYECLQSSSLIEGGAKTPIIETCILFNTLSFAAYEGFEIQPKNLNYDCDNKSSYKLF
jgi:hypothetical protein